MCRVPHLGGGENKRESRKKQQPTTKKSACKQLRGGCGHVLLLFSSQTRRGTCVHAEIRRLRRRDVSVHRGLMGIQYRHQRRLIRSQNESGTSRPVWRAAARRPPRLMSGGVGGEFFPIHFLFAKLITLMAGVREEGGGGDLDWNTAQLISCHAGK